MNEGPSVYNSLRYDGYMFYQEASLEAPELKDTGYGRLTLIPGGSFTGWICYYNGEDEEQRYDCKSVLVPIEVITE